MNPPGLWRRDVIGWSLYDLANTIYSMNIVSLYLKRYLVEDLGKDDRYFDIPFAISMAVAALLLPALGAMSDRSAKRKTFLALFTLSCCLAIGGMAFVPPSAVLALMILFAISNFSYEAGMPFYNALLYSVAEGKRARFVSGLGVALGYVGSILGMILALPFVTGELFGWNVPFLAGGGKSAAFLPTAALFALFSIPLFLWVKDRGQAIPGPGGLRQAYRDVWEGVRQTKKYPGTLRFLIADYFFEDAVATVIINIGIYCSIVVGLSEGEITTFLIISTISAVIGSFAVGKLAEFVSLKKLIAGIVWGWIAALLVFVLIDNMTAVWILGSAVGVLLGGIWTTTRPFLAEMVPREELGRFFGLFSLSGRAGAILGPLVWTAVVYFFDAERPAGRAVAAILGTAESDQRALPYKMAALSLALMMIIGLIIFRKLPDRQSETARG